MSEIGARIRLLRKELNLTQQSFADKAEVHRAYLADIERGVREPSFNMLKAIFDTYKVSMDWLLSGKGPMYRKPETGIEAAKAANDAQDLTQEEKVMLELFRSLPRTEQEEVTRLARKEKELAEMQERLKKLERKTA